MTTDRALSAFQQQRWNEIVRATSTGGNSRFGHYGQAISIPLDEKVRHA